MAPDQVQHIQDCLQREKVSYRFQRRSIQDNEATLLKQKAGLRFTKKNIDILEQVLLSL